MTGPKRLGFAPLRGSELDEGGRGNEPGGDEVCCSENWEMKNMDLAAKNRNLPMFIQWKTNLASQSTQEAAEKTAVEQVEVIKSFVDVMSCVCCFFENLRATLQPFVQ